MNDVVCASSVEQLEAKIPKYFDRDYVQHVDGKTIGYDDFVEHMKVVHGKIKDVSVRWKELHAYAFANDGKRETHIFSHHVVSYKDRASGAEGSAEVCGLFKCGTDLIFECNEMTTVTHGSLADIGSAHGVRRVRPRDPKTTPKIPSHRFLYITSSFPSSSRFKHLATPPLASGL